jgi:hypothetical protein
MLFFALRMLGFGKKLLELAIKYWKIVLPVVIIIVEFFVVSNVYYNKGVTEERTKWEKKIEIEGEKNRKLTESIATQAVNYGELARKQDQVRVQKEIVHENSIKTIIQEKPIYKECKTDADVLKELNAIRGLTQ